MNTDSGEATIHGNAEWGPLNKAVTDEGYEIEVASPCQSVCKPNEKTGFCLGCWRITAEIKGWKKASNTERLETLGRIHARRCEAKDM